MGELIDPDAATNLGVGVGSSYFMNRRTVALNPIAAASWPGRARRLSAYLRGLTSLGYFAASLRGTPSIMLGTPLDDANAIFGDWAAIAGDFAAAAERDTVRIQPAA